MKAIELLKISCEALKMMSKNGICLEDYKYVDAYEQFLTMRSFGMKYRSAITMLAEERHVGERTRYVVIADDVCFQCWLGWHFVSPFIVFSINSSHYIV